MEGETLSCLMSLILEQKTGQECNYSPIVGLREAQACSSLSTHLLLSPCYMNLYSMA